MSSAFVLLLEVHLTVNDHRLIKTECLLFSDLLFLFHMQYFIYKINVEWMVQHTYLKHIYANKYNG